jgi:hypothetical protein
MLIVFIVVFPFYLQIIFTEDFTEVIDAPTIPLHCGGLSYSLQLLSVCFVVVYAVWRLVVAEVAQPNLQPIVLGHRALWISAEAVVFFKPLR